MNQRRNDRGNRRGGGARPRVRDNGDDLQRDHGMRGRRQDQGRGGRGGRQNVRRRDDVQDDEDVIDLDQREPAFHQPPLNKQSRFRIGWKKLMELKVADPQEIVIYLNGNKKVFTEDVLKKELYKDKPDWIPLVLSISLRVCEATAIPESVIEYLTTLANSDFISKNMGMHLMNMTMEKSVDRQEKNKETLILAIRLFQELLTRVPTQAFQAMFAMSAMLSHILTFLRMKTNIVDEEIESGVELVQKMVEDLHQKEAEVVNENMSKCRVSNQQSDTPPDDFRTVSLIPQPKDLDLYEKPFLRANIARGRYDDVDHYLDVNFRLLREDFVRPLREGINDYLNPRRNRRQQHIRIYENVQILNPVCGTSGLNYNIRFKADRYKNVKWETSKRLLFGSLVCLSRDRFKTIVFGTISNRDVKKGLPKGEIEVRFEDFHDEITKAIRNAEYIYTMVETSAYYEAYRHVLMGLQRIENLPFEKHIVRCEPDIKPPRYMNRNTEYDMTSLLTEDNKAHMVSMYTGQYNIRPLDDRNWPTPEKIGLDQSQWDALKLALTKEIAIIQGPPGTGKTYIGLELVKVLLDNANVWRNNVENETIKHPILIVCYTNHALDQFLEGIQKFNNTGIVRVGGRCNSPSLEKYLLKNLKHRLRENREVPRAVFVGQQQVVEDMRFLEDEIADAAKKIALVEEGILHEKVLEHCVPPMLYEQLLDGPDNDVDLEACMMKEWLGYGTVPIFDQRRDGVVEMEVDEEQIDDNEEEGVDIDDEANMLERQRIIDELRAEDFFPVQERHTERTVDTSILGLKMDEIQNQQRADNGWQVQGKSRSQIQHHLKRQLQSQDIMTDAQVNRVRSLWRLPIAERWRMYRSFVQKFIKASNDQSNELQLKYSQAAERMKEITSRTDLMILQNSKIIGMTTTGAARCQRLLQEIKPKIVIVEEAAEVLESHIITSLSEGCEHLVLIGDHKQLRPSATVFKLAKNYNLEISFFERMINNEVEYKCLSYQHRMRPSIAAMMSFIYPELRNHIEVQSYENIKGIVSNVFFINHKQLEATEDELQSHYNVHEAEYISKLCRYLIMQGYNSNQITVLTPYSGQLHQLKRFMPKREFEGVRVTLVDNYQGEENDIILLSLVRSNKNGSIGFLKIENRVCVALSRAKKGLYVIGNIDHLALHSELWSKIYNHVQKERICGPALELYCQVHPEEAHIMAKDPSDFFKAPEGGCMRPCDFRLQCGHQCPKPCHIRDKDHTKYICRKPCQKVICDRGHRCTGTCAENCKPCKKPVEKQLLCGHKKVAECNLEPKFVKCSEFCRRKLDCGHECQKFCSQPCSDTRECTKKVAKTWPCGHKHSVPCNTNVLNKPCPTKCKAGLQCEHQCDGTCGTCWQSRIHIPCKSKCQRSLVCGHLCKVSCTKHCPPCTDKCRNRCMHSKCQKLCGAKCVPCNEPCTWFCKHYKCTKLCHELCNRPQCNEPCKKRLRKCGHPCIGLCGEPCPKLCRICNKDEVQEIFFGSEDEPDTRFVQLDDCGHVLEVEGLDRWISQGGSTEANSRVIQLPSCPKCKTPIQQHLRYGNIIKEKVSLIERVKERILGAEAEKQQTVNRLLRELNTVDFKRFADRENMKDVLNGEMITLHQINVIHNQLNIMKALKKMTKQVTDNLKASRNESADIISNLSTIEEKLLQVRDQISDQQLEDFSIETTRWQLYIRVCELAQKKNELRFQLSVELGDELVRTENTLTGNRRITEQEETDIETFLKKLKKAIPNSGLGISEAERVQIVQAIGLARGHWYACPNGHVYAIGECGGASQLGKCPECGSAIGGTRHTLTAGNRHYGLMDGSSYAAWSDQANMANYELNF
ncbi:NFX1-type zinc finger-containing protein 1-like [Tubulanus polymorphus]|uniref:NFX1-type zinc finger-containing protein 1-like n=1 Tax=Tubulanus polymorphus TaxID=672921 RepID=UPI003DA1D7F3